MLRALASAGADVVMHGLVSTDELKQKTEALQKEFGIKAGFSTANVRKPQEIRHDQHSQPCAHQERFALVCSQPRKQNAAGI